MLLRRDQHAQLADLVQACGEDLPQAELGIQRHGQLRHVREALLEPGGVVSDHAIEEVVNPLPQVVVEDRGPVAVVLRDSLPCTLRGHCCRDALLGLQLVLQLGVQLIQEHVRCRKSFDGTREQGLVDLPCPRQEDATQNKKTLSASGHFEATLHETARNRASVEEPLVG